MLLDVLSKGFWAILFSRVVPTLERLKAFRSGQFGARPGTNTAEPLTIVFALAELAFSDQVSLYVNNIDVSKAFDSPALGIGVESSLRRLGIDEAFIDYNLDLDIDNKVCVMTAYGTSEEILGSQDGVFSATRGVSQGMSESPLKWNCFHIVLADLQVSHVNEGVVEILNSGLRRTHLRAAPIVDQEHRICSTAFIDDMQLVSTTPRGVELRLNTCNLFLEFNAIQFNVDKTRILANLWQGEEYDLAKRTDWSAWIYSTDAIFNESGFCNLSNSDLHIGNEADKISELTAESCDKGVKYLGCMFSPSLESIQEQNFQRMKNIVSEFLLKLKAVELPLQQTMYLIDAVLWPKIKYIALFANLSDHQLNTINTQLLLYVLRKSRLSSKINRKLIWMPPKYGGFGFMHWRDRIYTERLELLQRLFARGSDLVKNLLRALIKRLQYQFASSQSVLSTSFGNMRWLCVDNQETSTCGWLGDLIKWMHQNHLSFILPNSTTLDGSAAANDITIVDFAVQQSNYTDTSIAQLQRACHAADSFWLSSFVKPDGSFTFDHIPSEVNARSLLKSVASSAFQNVNLGERLPGVHMCDVSVALVNDTLRFVEVQDIFESAVLAKEILIRESIRPRIGALCNAQLSDDLYEGSILNISGDNVLFSYDNKSIDVPLSDIDAFVLQPLDIRNTTLENFCSIQFVTSYEDFWLPRIALRRLPVKRQSIDSPNFRTPFSINLNFHELQLEISRFDNCIAQSLSPVSQPSRSLLNKALAQSRLNETLLCRKLGYNPKLWRFCCDHVIPELRDPNFLWDKPDLPRDKLIVVTDGSEKNG
eukprot:CAMPEP_0197323308 /NCGR_PEP_ID=MMETSP0891-20130614/70436_1 /TAXON_ID=44058 ORGANISM="Aureoumbra lagunensis, Strain CCMP1510" /NCGR_SAMPLE_ID=MMETSP0891 /ASSEMBLY_ACC=CAM_ASM_000534 /LENGTH=819 /DNA_ID=CAMNT_0042815913 /DNA_START=1014 /DNA_END=3470 /DNA_ORIENTATION=-